ncbi:dynein axonemal heavy chain 5-like isoform X4 [Ptychodera flava]|uniref:dynein axonemal heavy chain 5-like isoform X4 n=1 Tax=Ptychodera flava TaxID=63121 RepID=UPI00396A8454
MDERHWWIATKIQESFHIGGFHDNPTLLEDFLTEPETLEMINQFLGAGGPNKLFFYSDRPVTASTLAPLQSTRQLHAIGSLSQLKDVNVEETTVLYFLRHSVEREVDPVHMEKDVFCGELRHSTIDNLNTMLSDIYIPLLRAQKDWGECSEENVSQFLHQMDKYAAALAETSSVQATAGKQVLRRPETMVTNEFSRQRAAAYDQGIVGEYEALVSDWMSTIDNALADGGDERFMDPNSGPLSELERWKRRQRMLANIMEQLKGKECKTVIGVLISSKSKALKKWKTVDASITDAANETKDKVKYLESLKRHFDQLYSGATPASMISTALPGLMNSVKQMDSISKFYARGGYLGLLFTKITNQLVNACKDYIKDETTGQDGEDLVWTKVQDEIENKLGLSPQKPKAKKKGKDKENDQSETLFGRLKACLHLYSEYKNMVRTLRDNLGGAHSLTHFPSISSLGQGPPSKSKSGSRYTPGLGKSSKTPSVTGDDGHGVSFTDEETIFGHLDLFCSRVRQVLDVVNALTQYTKLTKTTEGLPRPRKEDLIGDDLVEEMDTESGGNTLPDSPGVRAAFSPQKSLPGQSGMLPVVEEEDTVSDAGQTEGQTDKDRESETTSNADEVHDLINATGAITTHNAALLRKLYHVDDPKDEGPSIASIVRDHLVTMKQLMSENVSTNIMLDVEGKEKDKFEEAYVEFLTTIQQIEMYMVAYLQAVFMRNMKTQESLDVIIGFSPIMHRQGMKKTTSEKFVEIFNRFEKDLDAVKDLYETHKEDPIMPRNAPPVAGSIHWSRQLLKRIEEPMKVFRENKSIQHMKDFPRIVKYYNRIATALVTFESLWFSQWKSHIDHAKTGLKATLLIHHPQTGDIVVNADDSVLQLIHECRWMTRLGIGIPDSALQVMKQEQRFKNYKNHLELCLSEFHDVCSEITEPLRELFQPHVDGVIQSLQPGLTTLAWNSMNIDAFLHQVHSATLKLKNVVERVSSVVKRKIVGKIESIASLFLFDMDLAFSRSWPPSEFCHEILQSVRERGNVLYGHVNDIEAAIHELVDILKYKKGEGSSMSPTSLSATSYRGSPKGYTTPTTIRTSRSGTADDQICAELLGHYSSQVYDAVMSAVCRSLLTLAEASGCDSVFDDHSHEIAPPSVSPEPIREEPRPSSSKHHSRPATRSAGSRSRSAGTRSRPMSSLSFLSDMTWTTDKSDEVTYLRFEVEVKFAIPNIIIEPTLDSVQEALGQTGKAILAVTENVLWWGGEYLGEPLYGSIQSEPIVQDLMGELDEVVDDLQRTVDHHLFHFRFYDFLWRDDMRGNFLEFINADPGQFAIKREVERLLHIENKLQSIPSVLPVGPICLTTSPITDALYGFAIAWKSQYAKVLHEEAKRKLDLAVLYRSNVTSRLSLDVTSLDQLNTALNLLEELRDMENKIDAIYLPIETAYANLQEYKLRLPRSEVEEVEGLRDRWQEVIDMAESSRVRLLKEQRLAFEQELDKQTKLFVVEVIQFRNSFDAQGPAVPGVPPSEAVTRLHEFQNIFKLYSAKRKTLDSVARLFGIVQKPFPELDRTGEELDLLGLLYGLFQKFIAFDNRFRDTLWADADLQGAHIEVGEYWEECDRMPDKLKDWDAYNDMKNAIKAYLDVFPLLHKLASQEIRNRHWLQVMSVTGSSFQLEANVFKLLHLLDIGLIKHQAEIEEICRCASKELELEVKLRITEEEWTEQVLTFQNYKKRGPIYLEKDSSEHLLEQLEDAQALLANMLTSRYIGPLREEAAGWAEKLKAVGMVLEQWLEVQDLWQYLEAVFSISATAKELPQEAKRFSRIDKSWIKIMKRAYDTRNVLQSSIGGEVPKGVVLRHIQEELEICFKSLIGYLDNKRRAFPRFFFMSDAVLLSVLSRPNDLESVRPHLRAIFNNVYDVKLEKINVDGFSSATSPDKYSGRELHHSSMGDRDSSIYPTTRMTSIGGRRTPTTAHSGISDSGGSQNEHNDHYQAVSVVSQDGEMLPLDEEVQLHDGVEVWLKGLQETISKTIFSAAVKALNDVNAGLPLEELAFRYPGQVGRLGLLSHWTRECELGIAEIRYERKALNNSAKKFLMVVNRISSVMGRGVWRGIDEPVTAVHKLRLESLLGLSLYLRDTLENMANRKIREPGDFEWRRCIRCYMTNEDGKDLPQIVILDDKYTYGGEFYDTSSALVLNPVTERAFLAMSMALNNLKGSAIIGSIGVGKTETAKGLAFLLGKYMAVFSCSPESDASGLSKILHGLAMDGCWGCFDEFQNLQKDALAILLDHIHVVTAAIKAKQKYCTLGDGDDVILKPTTAFFITINPEIQDNYKIPTDVSILFRNVSIAMPDVAMILRAKCASYGFKSPKILADRLKIVAQHCKDQMPPATENVLSLQNFRAALMRASLFKEDLEQALLSGATDQQHKLGMNTLSTVIQFAHQKKRTLREDRMESSRSNSQASMMNPQLTPTPTTKTHDKAALKRAGIQNPLSPAAKAEHALVAQCLLDVIGPRLKPDAFHILTHVVKDVFAGLGEPPTPMSGRARKEQIDVEQAIIQKAQDNGLVPHAPWVNKAMQVYAVSKVSHGIIVAGPPGSGKSACIQTLVDALSGMSPLPPSSRQSRTSSSALPQMTHKLQRINPLVVDDLSLMFGSLNQNHDWVDGVFTAAWRKANRNVSNTWLCMDGPLSTSWIDNFNSVLDNSRTLHLRNGDRLFLSHNVRLLFETSNLSDASPASVARAGIVFLDKEVLGWRPIAEAWLENRSDQEVHSLQRAFNKTMDAVVNFVLYETRPKIKLGEVDMFKSCLGLLAAMLNEREQLEIGGELHTERLFLFCLIWTFGGLLEGNDRKHFSDHLRTLTSALPDYDTDISVYDYYVDESGEWDPWVSKVPDSAYTDTHDLLGEVFVDTIDTIRTRMLMEFASISAMNVLLIGPPGCGKTSLINDFLDQQDPTKHVTKRVVFSGASKATQFQQFIEANIHHRQGFVYGARDNKRLQIFIDDLNLPNPDEHGTQRSLELLRQMVDDKLLVTLKKPFEWRTLQGLVILSAMTMHEFPSTSTQKLPDRLIRHFAIFNLPEAKDSALESIVTAILEGNMTRNDTTGLVQELHEAIVKASCKILATVQDVLRPTPMIGRYHYMFTLKDLTVAFQCLTRLSEEARADENMVISLWRHEIKHIMQDRLCRTADINWFEQNLAEIISEYFPQVSEGQALTEYFVTFPTEPRAFQRPVTSISQKTVKVVLQPISEIHEVHKLLHGHMTRYNEEFGNENLNIMLSDFIIKHIIRMHRVISFHHGGNIMLVGTIGSHLATLTKLALHVADMPSHYIDSSKPNTFFDGLRSAIRLTGTEGKMLTLVFTGRDVHDERYMDAINSLLVSGEYPHLFSNDELEGLLQALGPALKRHAPNYVLDPMKFFVSRVKSNLHIILCLPPSDELLQIAPSQYPGLLTGMQMDWMCDWSTQALGPEAQYYVYKHHLAKECGDDVRDNLVSCISDMHSFVLQDCKQIPWAGVMDDTIPVTSVKIVGKKEVLKVQVTDVANLPYTKTIMSEHITQRHRDVNTPGRNDVFVGPRTFRRFLDCFRYIFNTKNEENSAEISKLKKALNCLSKTRQDAKSKHQEIKKLQAMYEQATKTTANLLKELTAKATVLEKVKAQFGMSSGSLSAFLQMNEIESEEEEEDELLANEEEDEYDKQFELLREANLKSRQVKIEEELITAKKKVDDCRASLQQSRDQVIHWKSKVDRACIERLRSFQNPPLIVLQVMEMVLTLIGKQKPIQNLDKLGSDSKLPNEDASLISGRQSTSSGASKSPSKGWRAGQKDSTSSYQQDDHTRARKSKKDEDKERKAKWKQIQIILNDSLKFVEMLQNLNWENGLNDDVLAGVEYYLPKSKDGEGVTGEGSLLDVPGNVGLPDSKRRSPSPGNSGGITISATRYSSEDAGTLVAYTCAIVEYSHRCGPLREALRKLDELEREKTENERMQREREERELPLLSEKREQEEKDGEEEPEVEPEYTEDDIPKLQAEVDKLQAEFDASVVEKHSLEMELEASNERLRAATEMIHSLKSKEVEWREYVNDNSATELLISNCLVGSAFLTYCAPMDTDTRRRFADEFNEICNHHGLAEPKRKLFQNMSLIDFLYSKVDIQALMLLQLPMTPIVQQNACFIMQELSSTAWNLLCDPTSRVQDWLEKYLQGSLIHVKYHELRSQLETCLSEGQHLLVTDCNVHELAEDDRFFSVLRRRMAFLKGRQPFKMMVGDHEVECSPAFRLYLHTTAQPHQVPNKLAAYTAVTHFHQVRADIEEELLDRFMAKEKARLNDEKQSLAQEKIENMKDLEALEKQMLNCLAGDTRLLNDLVTTKKLAEMKKHYDETLESQDRIHLGERSITNAREGYRAVAKRGAVCFDTARMMAVVHDIYRTAWNQFLEVYDISIKHSDRAAVKAVVDRLTFAAYTTTARGLLERDRLIYSILLALEVEDSEGNLGPGEREFLVSPSFGASVMQAIGKMVPPDHRIAQAKKPFDWMLDEQFHNLQILAVHYEWFQDMFERMPKDGRETQWRAMGEHETPELMPLPEKMDENYSPIQKLLVTRAFRQDRLMQASTVFVCSVLGKKYVGDVAVDFSQVLRQTSPYTPILLMYSFEGEMAERMFRDYALKKQMQTVIVPLYNAGHVEERKTRRVLVKAMQEGFWVLMQNGHNSTHLLDHLETILAENKNPDPNFRVWIAAQVTSKLPVRVLQTATKIVVDSPRKIKESMIHSMSMILDPDVITVMKDNMIRSLSVIDADTLKSSSRSEWAPMVHNLCMLHGAIRLRSRFGRSGWNRPYDMDFSSSELFEALQVAATAFKDMPQPDGEGLRGVSWIGIRYILTEIIYGSYITDDFDQQSLTALVEYWVGPNAVKRDFEATKLRFRIPAAFFNPNLRVSSILQALENVPNHALDVPEACGIHTSMEDEAKPMTNLGDDQYVFTRLNAIFDAMPESNTLSHALMERPPTPQTGPSLANVTSVASTMALDVAQQGVYASASFSAAKNRKEVEIWEICHTLLPKLPRGWNRDYIAERIKKIGGDTPFNRFMLREIDLMIILLGEVRLTLQTLKQLTENPTGLFGDRLSAKLLSIADDLYHQCVPEHWRKLAGESAPPVNWPLGSWFNDLSQRCQHFERILVLGREKFPAFWLGAFFYPKAILAMMKQDAMRIYGSQTSQVEQFVFQTEITARDKDHVRDPPQEGMFVHGIYMWGCTWEKTTGELHDTPPKHGPTPLPIVHVLCMPQSEKPALNDPQKAAETYACPVYPSRICPREPVMVMDVRHDSVPAQRWALRGLSATIRPY